MTFSCSPQKGESHHGLGKGQSHPHREQQVTPLVQGSFWNLEVDPVERELGRGGVHDGPHLGCCQQQGVQPHPQKEQLTLLRKTAECCAVKTCEGKNKRRLRNYFLPIKKIWKSNFNIKHHNKGIIQVSVLANLLTRTKSEISSVTYRVGFQWGQWASTKIQAHKDPVIGWLQLHTSVAMFISMFISGLWRDTNQSLRPVSSLSHSFPVNQFVDLISSEVFWQEMNSFSLISAVSGFFRILNKRDNLKMPPWNLENRRMKHFAIFDT